MPWRLQSIMLGDVHGGAGEQCLEMMQKVKEIVWNLDELHDSLDSDSISGILGSILDKANNFESSYRGKVATLSSMELHEAIELYEDIKQSLYRLSQF